MTIVPYISTTNLVDWDIFNPLAILIREILDAIVYMIERFIVPVLELVKTNSATVVPVFVEHVKETSAVFTESIYSYRNWLGFGAVIVWLGPNGILVLLQCLLTIVIICLKIKKCLR